MRVMRTGGQAEPSLVAFQDASPGVRHFPFSVLGYQRLAGEAIGTFDLTLQNCVVGSTYRVEVQSTGAQVAIGTISTSTTVLTLPLFPAGNAANSLRVKLRKGTSEPYYKPWDTVALAASGGVSIYVSQIPD